MRPHRSSLCLGLLFALLTHVTSPWVIPVADQVPASDNPDSAPVAEHALGTNLTWPELDDLGLARRALSKDGREALRHLAQTKLLDVLGRETGLSMTDAQVDEQLAEIKRQIAASGEKLSAWGTIVSSGWLCVTIESEILSRSGM